MHKETDNIDTLIRDLDSLGVKPEIDLSFTRMPLSADSLPPEYETNEYEKGLAYNDTHSIKIRSLETSYIQTLSFSSKEKELEGVYHPWVLKITFSNNVVLEYTKFTRALCLYDKDAFLEFDRKDLSGGYLFYETIDCLLKFGSFGTILDSLFQAIEENFSDTPLIYQYI